MDLGRQPQLPSRMGLLQQGHLLGGHGQDTPVPADQAAATPLDLAHIAYGFVHVPDTKVTLAPSGPTKVNLPTWAWLDKADFKPVSVTATLANYHISSTVTATPQSLKLEPGTADAELSPHPVCVLS